MTNILGFSRTLISWISSILPFLTQQSSLTPVSS
ncbi:hypothetical protein Gogos_001439, partial [Gossypium gossypioides]|nr:hypothetical protein [Gossypium gossypioides]